MGMQVQVKLAVQSALLGNPETEVGETEWSGAAFGGGRGLGFRVWVMWKWTMHVCRLVM